MKRIDIREKLKQLEFETQQIVLGDFDLIGEYTAKKNRKPTDALYKTAGCFFRPNYERGILAYHLIKRFDIKSVLEIGFGRGYFSFCCAKAFTDCGIDGKIFSVDPMVDENHLKSIAQVFPQEWFKKLFLMRGDATQALKVLGDQRFDLIYIDGDHRYDAVKSDWEITKDRYDKFILFDDYDNETIKDIEVKRLVDEIDAEKELIISDRRMFLDERGIKDEDINYGQVLIKNPNFDMSAYLTEW
jgi:hypothetical protein